MSNSGINVAFFKMSSSDYHFFKSLFKSNVRHFINYEQKQKKTALILWRGVRKHSLFFFQGREVEIAVFL